MAALSKSRRRMLTNNVNISSRLLLRSQWSLIHTVWHNASFPAIYLGNGDEWADDVSATIAEGGAEILVISQAMLRCLLSFRDTKLIVATRVWLAEQGQGYGRTKPILLTDLWPMLGTLLLHSRWGSLSIALILILIGVLLRNIYLRLLHVLSIFDGRLN